jgi:hypothetical protein
MVPHHLRIDPRQRVADLAGRPGDRPRIGDRCLSTENWDLHYLRAQLQREQVDYALNADELSLYRDRWSIASDHFDNYQVICQLLWDSVYFQMYYFLDDIIGKDWFESEQPIPLDLGLHWHHDKRPCEIQATAEHIQATCTDKTRNPICEWVTRNRPQQRQLDRWHLPSP